MQSKQYFTKIKNYPHEKSTEPLNSLIIRNRLSANIQKRSVALTLLRYVVLAIPFEETGKTTLCDCITYPALNIPSI